MWAGYILIIIGILFFLYLFWKRLNEDYLPANIFTTAFYIVAGQFGGFLIAKQFMSEWWFWLGMTGLVSGYILGMVRFKLRFYETFEALVFAELAFFGFFMFSIGIVSGDRGATITSVFSAIMMLLFGVLDRRYKNFTWYKSGRAGFAGMVVVCLFFLVRTAVAVAFGGVISFVGDIDAIMSGVLTLLSFTGLYYLAQKRI